MFVPRLFALWRMAGFFIVANITLPVFITIYNQINFLFLIWWVFGNYPTNYALNNFVLMPLIKSHSVKEDSPITPGITTTISKIEA